MLRAGYAPMLATLLAVTACENPLGPAASVSVELTVQADNFIPGQAVPIALALHNPTSSPIELSGCRVGVQVQLPDGEVVDPADAYVTGYLQGVSFLENPWRDTIAIGPSDSVVFHGTWTGYGADAAGDSTLDVALGTYRLRPYLSMHRRGRGGRPDLPPYLDPEFESPVDAVLYGPAAPLPMVPWTRARFMHSYVGVSSVDLLVDGRLAAKALEPGGLSLVEPVVAGMETVEIRPVGSSVPLSTTSLTFSEGIVHTIVLRAGPQGPEPWDVTDTTAHPGPTESALRVIHLAVDAPDIEVFRMQPDRPRLLPVMSSFPYGSASRYTVGSPGRWTVVVTANAGTDTLLVAPVELKGGELRTMTLLDDGQGGVQAPTIIP